MLHFFTDAENEILTDISSLSIRDKEPRVGLRQTGETSFSLFCFLENGAPKLQYDIDVAKYEKGMIHSLPSYNTIMNSIPTDRVDLEVFLDMPPVAAMKMELGLLQRMTAPNSVLFYIIPGTDDTLIYSRESAYFENVEPIIVNTNNFHEIIKSRYALYEDPRPLNTLRMRTLLALDPNDSLAYLEAQLDFVTAVVLAVVEKHPELKLDVLESVREYANFKDAVEGNLLFGVKDQSRCVEEIRTNKARARRIQSAYYEARTDLTEKTHE